MAGYKHILRSELFSVWLENCDASHSSKMLHVRDYVFGKSGYLLKGEDTQLKKEVSRMCSKFQKRWFEAKRNRKIFEIKNRSWLCLAAFSSVQPLNVGGRPRKSFMELNKQNKRRRVEVLRHQGTPQELALAAEMNVRKEGCEDAAKIMQETMQTTPSQAVKLRQAWKSAKSSRMYKVLTDDEGLGLFIDGDFSRDQWILLRKTTARCNAPQIYPSYKKLLNARKKCLPDRNTIEITEILAEVPLQELLDHTAQRILSLDIDGLDEIPLSADLELLCKWGFDGSSDHHNYKQKFVDDEADDSSIFITSMVPLQLRLRNNPEQIIWINHMPSSTRLCRPIRIQFRKETTALSLRERDNIQAQISNLVPKLISNFRVHYSMVCSMIDGKVCSALTGTSSQNCCVCQASPKQFNNLEAMKLRPVNNSTFEYGVSPLHARIR